MGRRVLVHVEIWVVEFTAEEWNGIMAASAPPRRIDISIAFHQIVTQFRNACQVRRVVERTEFMGTV